MDMMEKIYAFGILLPSAVVVLVYAVIAVLALFEAIVPRKALQVVDSSVD
jgi:hypothetical protein